MKTFIVVGASRGLVLQVLLGIHTFTKAECFVVCPSEVRYLRLSGLCMNFARLKFDGSDDGKLVRIANMHAEHGKEPMVVGADCEGIRMINRVRGDLKARCARMPDDAMLDLFDDKWRFYKFCREHGLNVPHSVFAESKGAVEFDRMASELGLPFVVKPVNQQASNGVVVIAGRKEFQDKILNNDGYRFAPLIVQRAIRGIDVGLNIFAERGIVRSVSMQQRAYPQNDEARITFFYNDYLSITSKIVCESSKYDGVMNIDGRIETQTGDVYLFESNPRFWRSHSASVWCGLNFVAEVIDPTPPSCGIRMLVAGTADTFYHPLYRPHLWPHVAFGLDHRGHMARLMFCDFCTLASQLRSAWRKGGGKRRSPIVPLVAQHSWKVR